MRPALSVVDHLIYGTRDLEGTIADLERRFGISVSPGGQHPGQGTRNALFGLGGGAYLEVMGPDPDQPDPGQPRWLGLDDVIEPRLIGWSARAADLESRVREAATRGVDLGAVAAGGRRRLDGSVLAWRVTTPRSLDEGLLVPFFIDWGESAHPAATVRASVELAALRGEHPAAAAARRALAGVGIEMRVTAGDRPALVAEIATPLGRIELR